jgi:hypothetical protein
MEPSIQPTLKSTLQEKDKFTVIWQAEPNWADWPWYGWIKNLFDPYVSETIIDGKHEVVMDNAIVIDAHVYARDPAYHAKFHGMNAFLVHPFDEWYGLGVDRYAHYRGVFRQYWTSVFNPNHVMFIPLGCYNHEPPATIIPSSERRYAWSFIGEGGKSSRPDMVRAMSAIEPHICFSTTPIRGITFLDRVPGGKRRIPRQECFDILAQSIFAPSPMGNVNIECERFYEALQVGAIPIVERRWTLDYYKRLLGDHPLPTVSSWSEGRQLVIKLLDDPARLDRLQQTCMQWWKSYKLEIVKKIGVFLEERSGTQDELVPLQSNLPRLPFWQYAELLRHHNLPAVGRRVIRQGKRVVQMGKWRVAITRSGDV